MNPINPGRAFARETLAAISVSITRRHGRPRPSAKAKLVLLPLDPDWLHVYWQVPAGEGDGPARLRLRLLPGEGEPAGPFELELQGYRNQRNIWVPGGCRHWAAELYAAAGEEVLAKAGGVQLPNGVPGALPAGTEPAQAPLNGSWEPPAEPVAIQVDGRSVQLDEQAVHAQIAQRLDPLPGAPRLEALLGANWDALGAEPAPWQSGSFPAC